MSLNLNNVEEILGKIKRNEINVEEGYDLIEKIRTRSNIKKTAPKETQKNDELLEYAINYLKEILSEVIGLATNKISEKHSLEKYGIDSVLIMEINEILEKDFEGIQKTLLFEYTNLYDLACYFVMNHESRLLSLAGDAISVTKGKNTVADDQSQYQQEQEGDESIYSQFRNYEEMDTNIEIDVDVVNEDIAIIGVNGTFPQAKGLDEFWENLKSSKNSITEIPNDRWDHSRIYDPEKGKKGKVYSKWGGFIDHYDNFDPLFFSMTPRDAELIDPQERIFLESVHATIEDAGYSRNTLWESSTAVFVGVMYGHYQLFGAEETQMGNASTMSSSFSSIANRVSYYFNFNGPSLALDTMCSSSLTALHLACNSIHQGDCNQAIVGGVNLTIHPDKYLFLCNQRFASSEGKCRAFGEGGDGYVPGEGVGSILIKPLSQAKRDKDNIYCIIKATAVNHGGKTNGYTVPNPNAQTRVITDALKRANINPRAISYLEAHGTGTSLGDPIEITGLSKAYRKYTKDNQYCSIGSVKTNVGHLESAAGIVAIIKVLLQMKHKQLVPSIHSEELNSNINFKDSPFYVQQKLEEWRAPLIKENGIEKEYPRCAGISSFGAGGSNVHVILEEYIEELKSKANTYQDKQIFILSAKNNERLMDYARQVVTFLDNKKPIETVDFNVDLVNDKEEIDEQIIKNISEYITLVDQEITIADEIREYGLDKTDIVSFVQKLNDYYKIDIPIEKIYSESNLEWLVLFIQNNAFKNTKDPIKEDFDKNNIDFNEMIYTLQNGRDPMEYRLAIIVKSVDEIIEKLKMYIKGEKNISNLFSGDIHDFKNYSDIFDDNTIGDEFIASLLKANELTDLSRLWTAGVNVSWELLYKNHKPKKCSLPTYPFERKSYWYKERGTQNALEYGRDHKLLSPMIDTNESVFEQQIYKKVLTKNDFYMRDHNVKGNMVLPGVAYLEMALQSGVLSTNESVVSRLSNIEWKRAISLVGSEDVKTVYISLEAVGHDVEVSIYSINENASKTIYFTCDLYFDEDETFNSGRKIDVQGLIESASKVFDKEECYEKFGMIGIDYGSSFRVIDTLYICETGTLSKIYLAEESIQNFDEFMIHPSLADGAMQTALCSITMGAGTGATYVPYRLEEVKLIKPLSPILFAFVEVSEYTEEHDTENQNYDLYLLDESYEIVAAFKGLAGKEYKDTYASNSRKLELDITGELIDDILTRLVSGEYGIDEVEKMLEEI